MKITKVLLVNPPHTLEERYGKGFSKIGATLPPMGLLYIAASLERKGYKVDLLDAQVKGFSRTQAVNECVKINPDLIGITCLTSNFNKSIDFCKEIKKNLEVPIIIGGPHAGIRPEEVLKNKCVDFVVKGEGEFSIAEIIEVINSGKINDLHDVDGIGFKEDGKMIFTKPRKPIKDLDLIHFPARHLLDLNEYKPSPPHYKRLPTTTIITSRGCPYACTYCSNSIWGSSYRQRSVNDVISEIKHLIKEYGIKDLNFWDDIFGLNRDWIHQFCETIKKENIDISWHCEFRANLADKETLIKMANSGCWAIFFGCESMDQSILDIINKKITPQQIRNAIKWTKEAGIEVRANFIIGLPNETPKKAKMMVKEIIKINPDYVKFNILTPYPGTVLYDQIKSGKWGEMTEEFNKLTGYFPTFRPWGYRNLSEVQKMNKMKKISIIIPTYNERNNIEKLIPDIEKLLSENGLDGEIIIIDDNSPDGTGKFAEELNEKYGNIKVLHRRKKEGVGSARRLGFLKAANEIIISMEGDNTHNPKYITTLVSEIERGADLVIGSRYLKGSKIVNWPLKRRVISKVANFIARFFAGAKLTDVTNGYRAFTRKLFESLMIDSTGFSYNMEFACEAYSRQFRIKEIPIVFQDRKKGQSKMHVGKEFFSFINTAFKFAYTYRPMKIFGNAGLLFVSLGLVLSLYLINLKLKIGLIGNRIPLITLSFVLIIAGVQLISFGIIASLISKLRREILR